MEINWKFRALNWLFYRHSLIEVFKGIRIRQDCLVLSGVLSVWLTLPVATSPFAFDSQIRSPGSCWQVFNRKLSLGFGSGVQRMQDAFFVALQMQSRLVNRDSVGCTGYLAWCHQQLLWIWTLWWCPHYITWAFDFNGHRPGFEFSLVYYSGGVIVSSKSDHIMFWRHLITDAKLMGCRSQRSMGGIIRE